MAKPVVCASCQTPQTLQGKEAERRLARLRGALYEARNYIAGNTARFEPESYTDVLSTIKYALEE